jgi:hypothetical protein
VQLQNRLEALLEEAHIKVSSLVSDLLRISARRMLQALADGETDPAKRGEEACQVASAILQPVRVVRNRDRRAGTPSRTLLSPFPLRRPTSILV